MGWSWGINTNLPGYDAYGDVGETLVGSTWGMGLVPTESQFRQGVKLGPMVILLLWLRELEISKVRG